AAPGAHPGECGAPREAGRPADLCHLLPDAGGERGSDCAFPREPCRLRAEADCGVAAGPRRPLHAPHPRQPRHRRLLRCCPGAREGGSLSTRQRPRGARHPVTWPSPGGAGMVPRISVLTLGVDDLHRSVAFYRDGLGLPTEGIVGTEFEHGAVAFFDLQPQMKLAVWARADLARDTGLPMTTPC